MCTPLQLTRWLTPVLFLCACAPPPEVGPTDETTTEPSIRLLYPIDQDQLFLDPTDCSLAFDVVVDIDNLDIIDPSTVEENADGQGHWHLYVNGDKVTGKAEVQRFDSASLQIDGTNYLGSIEIEGELQSNGHEPLEEFTNFSDRIEVTVQVPEGASCP